MLKLAYNTNGLAHHRLDDALGMLADLGYAGCSITLDQGHLDPYAQGIAAEVERIGRVARGLGLALIVETGGRYLLDARKKHHPTLISDEAEGRARRVDFYARAISIARDLGAEVVSLWSGIATNVEDSWGWLAEGMTRVLDCAEAAGVAIGFEPEPGMFIDDMRKFSQLTRTLGPRVRLTLDLGHAHLTEDDSVVDVIWRHADRLVNVHAEDMRRPLHEHLPFGEGEMDYAPILRALGEIDYRGLVSVELSRDSHRGAEMARRSIGWLKERGA